MDNVTHSLVGLAIAETTLRGRESKLRGPLYFASFVATNIPDLDFIYAKFLAKPLGYVLHHRGHTHTLISILPQALLVLLMMFLYSRWKKLRWSGADWRSLTLVSFLGVGVHLLLDSLNSYGVHPFWPWNNTWYYLDAIFILEPMFWIALAPMLAVAAPGRWRKAIYWGIFGGALAMLFFVGFMPLGMQIFYVLCGIAFALTALYFNAAQRAVLASAYCVIFVSLLVIISQGVAGSVRSRIDQMNPEDSVADVVRTPFPGNPLCWNFHAVGSNSVNATYWIRSGRFQLPFLTSRTDFCSEYFQSKEKNVPQRPLAGDPSSERAGITWSGEFLKPLAELQVAARSSCQFGAFLQFARAPFWIENGERLYFGDIRYDRDSSKGFAEFESNANAPCPRNLPGWRAPIHDLLRITDQ